MQSVDVNVLFYAFNRASPHHDSAKSFVENGLRNGHRIILFPSVVSGFFRLATDRRIMTAPAHPDQVLGFMDQLLTSNLVTISDPGTRVWPGLRTMIARYQPRGAEVTDVFLAAAALEAGVQWVSYDRGFARFSELTWINPADPDLYTKN